MIEQDLIPDGVYKEEMLGRSEKEKQVLAKEDKYFKTLDKGHGRCEKRGDYISNEIDCSYKGTSGMALLE